MKVAFDTSLLRSFPLDLALKEISTAGYTHIEIGLAHFSPSESTGEDLQSLRDALSRNHLRLAALCGIYPLSYPDEEVRKVGVQLYLRAIETANNLDCKLLVSELNGDLDHRPESQLAFLKSFNEIRPYLEKTDVKICFEAHPGDFVESNTHAVDLIRKVNSSQLRYLYCAPHSFILGQNVSDMVEYGRNEIEYIHFADSLRPEKTFFSGKYFPKVRPHQHLLPGLGDVDLKGLIASLKAVNYEDR
jgi:myo-inositol catabolism protein IolH